MSDKELAEALREIVFLCCEQPVISRPSLGGHSGPGWYAHNAEYPDEGALFVGREPEDLSRLLEVAIAALSRHEIDVVEGENGDS